MQVFGMPRKVWRYLEKWFNHRPWPYAKPLILGGIKFWIERFDEDEDLEVRIIRHGRWIADIWVETKEDNWILYGINVCVEKYQHLGLGKFLLAQVTEKAKALGARSIRETIEKDCEWPKRKEEFSNLLKWYKQQGFVLTEDETNFVLTLTVSG
jgi:GNAT superfamily N-acetyltransferase